MELLKAAGHDVMTVWDQGLEGISEDKLFEVCRAEARALVTLDRDFGQVMRFPPETSAGTIILDVGPQVALQGILDRLKEFLAVLETRSVSGALWIVEPGRVRIHLREREE